MKGRIAFAPVLVAALIYACSSNSTNGGNSGGNASMTFAIAGGDFAGNSVRICGSRTAPDPQYRCIASLTPNPEDECPCFNFSADGSLVESNGAPVVISDLCPSADTPPANWNFTYELFSEPDCEGTQINDGTHNFTCYDSTDIASRAFPNQSAEDVLNSGLNTNHIVCATENASKQWNFTNCATTTTPADIAAGASRYDCGCTPAAGTCDCGAGGVTETDLEDGCAFDPATCEIVCTSSPVLPQGACLAASALSILVSGRNVTAYVPHNSWSGIISPNEGPDVSLVNLEGTSVTPTRIPTNGLVVSCASNSVTGQTVCVDKTSTE
ncbi:MAG: hypothetical protein FWD73_09530, partial [Polyangiaceae bacterium]|nr:hypothetical protein [Polyangiaceae bacterium]